MNKGKNTARPNFDPRHGAATMAQRLRRPDGPSQQTRGTHAQRVVTVLRTGAVARLSAPVTAMRWGAVTVESTSWVGPHRRAMWSAVELTGVTRRRGGGEGASARWCLSATHGVRWSAVAPGSPKAPWTRGGHEGRFKLKSCQSEGTSHQEGVEMAVAWSNPSESGDARCSGLANWSH
jgi:hypothetical protein